MLAACDITRFLAPGSLPGGALAVLYSTNTEGREWMYGSLFMSVG